MGRDCAVENGHGKTTLESKKKGPWTREEDQKLLDYIRVHGHGSWRSLPAKAGLERRGKSCRLRWTNYLRPDIKRGKFSPHEEKTIIRLHALLGNRWAAIAPHLPKRTENDIKNYWNTRLKKRLSRMGIDPATHRPKNSVQTKTAADVRHMAQWEAARLQAEARLTRNNKATNSTTRSSPFPQPRLPVLPCLDVLKVWQANMTTTAQSSLSGSPRQHFSSPMSTLSFSSPAISPSASTMGNDAMVANAYLSLPMTLNNVNFDHPLDSNDFDTTSSMDLAKHNCNLEVYEDVDFAMFGEFQNTIDCWNELVRLVNSPLESPWAF